MRAVIATRRYALLAALLIALAFALRAPVLTTGFTVDDYAQLGMMRGLFPLPRPALELFTFSHGGLDENARLREAGFFPWWSRADLRVALFRPLSSALMWFDLKVFGENAFAYHLHSAAWWLCMMALLAAVLRSMLPLWPALLAFAVCCAQSSHAMFLGWIANRNAAVASSFALLGLLLLMRARESQTVCARRLALAAFCLALCAGEYAVGYLPYAVLFELHRARSWRERLHRLAPWCALFASYLVLRASLEFGARGSGMYIDPAAEPSAFLRAASIRLPISAGDLVLGIQSNWWSAGFPYGEEGVALRLWPRSWIRDLRPLQAVQILCGLGTILIALAVSIDVFRRRALALRWLVIATPLALLPALSSVAESRLLLPPLLGWASVASICTFECFARAAHAESRARNILAGAALSLILICELVGPPFFAQPMVRGLPQLARQARESILAPELDSVLQRDSRVLLLAAADPVTSIYLPLVRSVHGRVAPHSCRLLTGGFAFLRLSRLSNTEFVIDRLQSGLTALDIYASAFNRSALHPGDSFRAGGMLVSVLRTFEGRPISTRYALDLALDDPRVVLLQQTVSGLRHIAFPRIGQGVILEPPMPPWQLAAKQGE